MKSRQQPKAGPRGPGPVTESLDDNLAGAESSQDRLQYLLGLQLQAAQWRCQQQHDSRAPPETGSSSGDGPGCSLCAQHARTSASAQPAAPAEPGSCAAGPSGAKLRPARSCSEAAGRCVVPPGPVCEAMQARSRLIPSERNIGSIPAATVEAVSLTDQAEQQQPAAEPQAAEQTLESSQPLTATARKSILSGLDLSHDPFYHPLQHGASLLSSMQSAPGHELPHASQLVFPGRHQAPDGPHPDTFG